MKIIVCMKAVPATSQVQVDGQFRLQRDGVKLEWNVADEAALEAALQLKENGSVTVLTMGPGKLEDSMRELLARGADEAVLVSDPAFAGSDTLATARVLAEAVKKLGGCDLLLWGRRAIDGETGQVPGMMAAMLNIPCVTNGESILQEATNIQVRRRLEAGTQVLSVQLPCGVSVCEYTYPLRLPGIMGMRRARQKQVLGLDAAALGIGPEQCGLKGSATRVVAMSNRFPGLRKGPKETDLSAGCRKLIELCREVTG